MDKNNDWDNEYADYAEDAAMEDTAMEDFIDESIQEISENSIRNYLGTYGDAIEKRINTCLTRAEELHRLEYYGSAITLSATAIELIIRFMLVRPLIQGAFLSDEWAEILTDRITTERTACDRKLLISIAKQRGIDITIIKLPDGQKLWESLLNMVWKKRNDFVHKGSLVTEKETLIGINCAKTLMTEVVYPIAKRLGFALEVTGNGKWCNISIDTESGSLSQIFTTESLFK